jgi:hypothetical protein
MTLISRLDTYKILRSHDEDNHTLILTDVSGVQHTVVVDRATLTRLSNYIQKFLAAPVPKDQAP